MMSFYEDLVTQTQMNFERYYSVYARGGVPYELADPSPLSYGERIERLVREIDEGRLGFLHRLRRGKRGGRGSRRRSPDGKIGTVPIFPLFPVRRPQ